MLLHDRAYFLGALEGLASKQLGTAREYALLAKAAALSGHADLAVQLLRAGRFTFTANAQLEQLEAQFAALYPERTEVRSARRFEKVFCIGLSRTGTSSMASVLSGLGYKTAHWTSPRTGKVITWDDIEEFEALSDTPISFLLEPLFRMYPDAGFIYTTRPIASWSDSLERHFHWCDGLKGLRAACEPTARGKHPGVADSPHWRLIHKALYASHDSWEDAYNAHHQRVTALFSGEAGQRLLTIDMTDPEVADSEKFDAITRFLRLPRPSAPLPHKNSRGKPTGPGVQRFEDVDQAQVNAAWGRFAGASHFAPPTSYLQVDEKVSRQPPKSAAQHYIYSTTERLSPSLKTFTLRDAYLSVDGTRPGHKHYFVFDANRKLVPEFSHGTEPFLNETIIELNDSPVAFIDDKFNAFNICHLLLDKLPRMDHFADANDLAFMLVTGSNYTRELFSLLDRKVVFALPTPKQRVTYRIKALRLTSGSARNFVHPAQSFNRSTRESLEWIKATLREASHAGAGDRPIYVSREGSAARRIVNEDEVRGLLEDLGFQTVRAEALSLRDQVAAFSAAPGALGLHGAGLTNGLFLPAGGFLGEILPPLCATGAYWEMASGCGLRYDALIARDPEGRLPDYASWKHDAAFNRKDVIVDREQLRPFVEALLKG